MRDTPAEGVSAQESLQTGPAGLHWPHECAGDRAPTGPPPAGRPRAVPRGAPAAALDGLLRDAWAERRPDLPPFRHQSGDLLPLVAPVRSISAPESGRRPAHPPPPARAAAGDTPRPGGRHPGGARSAPPLGEAQAGGRAAPRGVERLGFHRGADPRAPAGAGATPRAAGGRGAGEAAEGAAAAAGLPA